VLLCCAGTLGYVRMARRYRGVTREEDDLPAAKLAVAAPAGAAPTRTT